MKRTKLAGVGAAAVGALTAATALLLGSTAAVADEQRPDSAWVLATQGVLQINPVPYVESRDGKPVSDELIGLGNLTGPYGALSAGVLTARAEEKLASAKVTDLNVFELLKAEAVDTWCVDGKGGLEIVGGSVLGQPLPQTPVPHYELDLSPVAKLVLNDQWRNDDGTLTVNGIRLDILPGADSKLTEVLGDLASDLLPHADSVQSITIGSATCSGSGDGSGDNPGGGHGDDGDHGDDAGNGGDDALPAGVKEAPKPEVVAADLAVTG